MNTSFHQQFAPNISGLVNSADKILHILTTSQESEVLIKAMKKVPGMLDARTVDPEPLVSPMIKLLAHPNAVIKSLACDFIVLIHNDDSKALADISLLAVNILNNDLKDPNPEIRRIAINTICSLPALAESHSISAIQVALKDSNPMVRKSGVTGCGKIFRHSPKTIEDNDVIDTLYMQLKDPDPIVLTFVLQTLNVILEKEGGVVINNNMCKYFVKRLEDFPDMELCFLFEYLLKYFCSREESNDERKLMLMNALDKYLDSKKGTVFLSAANLFFECIKTLNLDLEEEDKRKKLTNDFILKIRPQFGKLLKSSSNPSVQEFQVQLLDFYLDMAKNHFFVGNAFDTSEEAVKLRSKDSEKLKKKKIEVLSKSLLNTPNNRKTGEEVLNYFMQELKKPENDSVKEEIISASFAMVSRSDFDEKIKRNYLRFIRNIIEGPLSCQKVINPLIKQIRGFPFKSSPDAKEDEDLSFVLQRLCLHFLGDPLLSGDKILVQNFLWIIQTHCQGLSDSVYYLETFLEENEDRIVQMGLLNSLLLCGVKLFVFHPAKAQILLGQIFEMCKRSNNQNASLKVDFYSKLLSNGSLKKEMF